MRRGGERGGAAMLSIAGYALSPSSLPRLRRYVVRLWYHGGGGVYRGECGGRLPLPSVHKLPPPPPSALPSHRQHPPHLHATNDGEGGGKKGKRARRVGVGGRGEDLFSFSSSFFPHFAAASLLPPSLGTLPPPPPLLFLGIRRQRILSPPFLPLVTTLTQRPCPFTLLLGTMAGTTISHLGHECVDFPIMPVHFAGCLWGGQVF